MFAMDRSEKRIPPLEIVFQTDINPFNQELCGYVIQYLLINILPIIYSYVTILL